VTVIGRMSRVLTTGAFLLALALATTGAHRIRHTESPFGSFNFKDLQGGINIETDQIENLSDQDLDYLRDAGVHSFRLFLWPKYGDRWNYVTPGQPMDPENNPEVARVSKFVQRVTGRDFAIILVPFGGAAYKPDGTDVSTALQVAWMEEFAAFAERHWDPNKVLIETWNEPLTDSLEIWRNVETQLIAAIHRKAPNFMVVATTLGWSSPEFLVKTKPYNDKNVIYDIHHYAPMDFTHQGAPWMGPHFAALCNNPYPGTEDYDAARIKANLAAVAKWAKPTKAKVIVGEFGVGTVCNTPEDKAAYLKDVRGAAEALGMGWLVWDFNKGFAIASQDKDGRWRIEQRFLAALGWH
jgi:endoglucanase